MDSDATKLFIYSVIGFIIGVVIFFFGFKILKKRNMIKNTPTSKIRSLAMGLVEIVGNVIPSEKRVLKSLLSQEDCVYYKVIVKEYRKSGKSGHWETIFSDSNSDYFFLKDETGMVLINPKNADVNITRSFFWQSGILRGSTPDIVSNFLNNNPKLGKNLFGFRKQLKFTEYLIVPKQKLYIMGTATDNPFVEDGTARDGTHDVMIQKGENEGIYLITDKDEKDLLKSLRWKLIGSMLGGPALILGSLAYILFYLGLF